MAYHYLRTHYSEKLRPVKLTRESANGHGEPTWNIEIAERASGNKGATMKIGAETGSTYSFEKTHSKQQVEAQSSSKNKFKRKKNGNCN